MIAKVLLSILVLAVFCRPIESFQSSQQPRVISQVKNRHCVRATTTSIRSAVAGESVGVYEEIKVPTLQGIFFVDITPDIRRIVEESGVHTGSVTVLSQHTTTAITINEMEGRLVDDARQFLLKLVPAAYPYLHNDLHLRKGPEGWPGGDEAWRAQEPINCHSHLIVMLLGTSEAIPISGGELKLGTWQSVIMAELDGPRTRTVAVSVVGVKRK